MGDLQIAPTIERKTLMPISMINDQCSMINDLCSLFTLVSSFFTLHFSLYKTLTSSTSKTRAALGGITPPAP